MVRRTRHEALQRLQAVAARQHQLVRMRDLARAGLTRAMIEGLVASGWLRRLHQGVYLLGSGEPSAWQRMVAAWMAVGTGAVISHSSAAAVHRLPHLVAGDIPEVTATGDRHPHPDRVRVHRVRNLDGADIQRRAGVLLTSPARTLVDLSPRLSKALLVKVIDEGAIGRLWTPESLLIARRRVRGRSGLSVLDQILKERVESPQTDSLLEARIERALRSLGPFEVHYQVVLGGQVFVIDFALPPLRLAVEADGWATRGRSRSKFDSDRRKSNVLAAHGWTVVRLTSAMSDDEMRRAVVDVMLRLAARTGPGASTGT